MQTKSYIYYVIQNNDLFVKSFNPSSTLSYNDLLFGDIFDVLRFDNLEDVQEVLQSIKIYGQTNFVTEYLPLLSILLNKCNILKITTTIISTEV